jgi:hypothetical protein
MIVRARAISSRVARRWRRTELEKLRNEIALLPEEVCIKDGGGVGRVESM